MPILYKIDILAALKAAGYSTYRIRQDRLLGEATLQLVREGRPISWENMSTLCRLLHCQPGDILAYADEGSGASGMAARREGAASNRRERPPGGEATCFGK